MKSKWCIEHYRSAKTLNDLVAMANQDAIVSVMLGATPDAAYGFIETAKAVASEKGWELPYTTERS